MGSGKSGAGHLSQKSLRHSAPLTSALDERDEANVYSGSIYLRRLLGVLPQSSVPNEELPGESPDP